MKVRTTTIIAVLASPDAYGYLTGSGCSDNPDVALPFCTRIDYWTDSPNNSSRTTQKAAPGR
jgi:hypothetical protein